MQTFLKSTKTRTLPKSIPLWTPPLRLQIVEPDLETKQEDEIEELPRSNFLTLSRRFVRDSGFSKALTRPIRVKLFSNAVFGNSAVNTAFSLVSPVTFQSSNFPEITQYSALYDEARVMNINVNYMYYTTVATASYSIAIGGLAISFDPSVSAPTTISQVCSEAHSTGPLITLGYPPDSNPSLSFKEGHLAKLHAKTPGPLAPITTSDVPGSAWFALDGGTAATIFALRQYMGPLGALGVTSLVYVVELDCEFRLRV